MKSDPPPTVTRVQTHGRSLLESVVIAAVVGGLIAGGVGTAIVLATAHVLGIIH